MSRPRKPGQLHKGWKKANKRLKKLAAAPDPAPDVSPSPWGPYSRMGPHKGAVIIPTPYHEGSVYDIIAALTRPPPTCQPQPERPPATGGEARSSGITGVAHDDTNERTRDS